MITLFNEDPRGLPAITDWPVDTSVISYMQRKAWDFCNRPEWSKYRVTGTEKKERQNQLRQIHHF